LKWTYPRHEGTGEPKEFSMIQLATDPTASRTSYRPVQSEGDGKASTFEARPSRTGHSWPFLSRYAERPSRQEGKRTTGTESGS
jgi:hypothetical protein